MSPTIRIDDDVFDELKKHAEPFVDTPNTVLRRLLGLGESVEGDAETELASRAPVRLAVAPSKEAQSDRRRRRRTKSSRAPRAKTGSILNESAYELPMLAIIAEHGGRAPAREVLDELG